MSVSRQGSESKSVVDDNGQVDSDSTTAAPPQPQFSGGLLEEASSPTKTIACPAGCGRLYSTDASLRNHLRLKHHERRMLKPTKRASTRRQSPASSILSASADFQSRQRRMSADSTVSDVERLSSQRLRATSSPAVWLDGQGASSPGAPGCLPCHAAQTAGAAHGRGTGGLTRRHIQMLEERLRPFALHAPHGVRRAASKHIQPAQQPLQRPALSPNCVYASGPGARRFTVDAMLTQWQQPRRAPADHRPSVVTPTSAQWLPSALVATRRPLAADTTDNGPGTAARQTVPTSGAPPEGNGGAMAWSYSEGDIREMAEGRGGSRLSYSLHENDTSAAAVNTEVCRAVGVCHSGSDAGTELCGLEIGVATKRNATDVGRSPIINLPGMGVRGWRMGDGSQANTEARCVSHAGGNGGQQDTAAGGYQAPLWDARPLTRPFTVDNGDLALGLGLGISSVWDSASCGPDCLSGQCLAATAAGGSPALRGLWNQCQRIGQVPAADSSACPAREAPRQLVTWPADVQDLLDIAGNDVVTLQLVENLMAARSYDTKEPEVMSICE